MLAKIGSRARVIAVCGLAAAGLTGREAGASPLSPRNASYTIEARLDPSTKTLEGSELVLWRNLGSSATDELWFHLYWNAWRNNRSTWALESPSTFGEARREDWGWIDVRSVRLHDPERGLVDLGQSRRHAAPDDGNAEDRTVLVVGLPRPVEPGESVTVELRWTARVPRIFARTGHRGDFYLIAQWFPKLGVFQDGGWSCHQFHAPTEFYSDYGVYDVRMTVPRGWTLGATGREVDRSERDDGSVTHHYVQEDVHDFAWTTSPFFVERAARFDEPGLPPVDLRLLLQPEHVRQAERHFTAARAALRSFGTWFGPYPHAQLTLVDPAWDSHAGGMEYPTLVTCGTRRFTPRGSDVPESVTVHETGHQFWQGVVGNDEFEHAWLDEGLDTYAMIRALEAEYGPRVLVRRYLHDFLPVSFPEIEEPRWLNHMESYRERGTTEVPSVPSWRFAPAGGGAVTYSKTALWLATLERHLGRDALDRILATFYRRSAFRHPTPDELFAVAEEVAGRDLDWFFDQVYRDSVRFDYAVVRAESRPLERRGWFERRGELAFLEPAATESDGERLFRTEVVVRRLGAGQFPVDVRLVFDDGLELRQTWDGRDRRAVYTFERRGRLVLAEVDPDHVLMLDVDRANNGRVVERASRRPALKWASKWMLWFQDLLSTYAFFV